MRNSGMGDTDSASSPAVPSDRAALPACSCWPRATAAVDLWLVHRPPSDQIADRLGRTPAQVVNRRHLQQGVVTIPEWAPGRIRSNADLDGFELSTEDLSALDGAGTA